MGFTPSHEGADKAARALLIRSCWPTVARDVGVEDRRELTNDLLLGHATPCPRVTAIESSSDVDNYLPGHRLAPHC